MTGRPYLWIVGSGGLLGKSIARNTPTQDLFDAGPFDWDSPRVEQDLIEAGRRFRCAAGDRPRTIVWSAGAGIIGTELPALQRETEILRKIVDSIGEQDLPATFFLASSAGGLYGGSREMPISEMTPISPISDYGNNKFEQEQIVRSWASRTGGRALIGRLSNLYGPGQSLSKRQGLISKICLSVLRKEPVRIYVSLDTVRDYFFVDDAARTIKTMLARSYDDVSEGGHLTKILAAGRSLSIGAVLGEAHRVLGRRPNCLMTRSPAAAQQSPTHVFRSDVWSDLDGKWSTPLPVGIWRTANQIRMHLQA